MRPLRIFAATVGLAACSAPLTVLAQQTPDTPPPMPPPSYARPTVNGEETIQGRIQSFDGKYHLSVLDNRGFVDNVQMHQGTIINPTGLTLQPGMPVTIMGYNRGTTFGANQIDTPYTAYVVPAYPYYPVSVGIGFGPVYFHHW